MQEPHIPKSLCYVSGQAFKDYIHDMEIVQKHAELNRKYIADTVIEKWAGIFVRSFRQYTITLTQKPDSPQGFCVCTGWRKADNPDKYERWVFGLCWKRQS